MSSSLLRLVLIVASLGILRTRCSDIRGPPQSKERVVKKIGNIGENLRLQCPIIGYPPPSFEWKKDGLPIDDITWIRYRTSKNFLKVKNANRDDTGIYTCKGINGFGSAEARIEVIVIDPVKYPPRSDGLDTIQVAPPVFTVETSQSEIYYRLDIGDIFKVSCEALGNPDPEIKWFKDGQEIRDPVRQTNDFGKSSVEFHVMGSADSGTYTCQAQNGMGIQQLNFTLGVNMDTGSVQHAVVMEALALNDSVPEGDTATLRCKVKSVALPHIKWLKKLDLPPKSGVDSTGFDERLDKVVDVYTLNMGNERFRVLETAPDILIGDGIFLNKLVIPSVELNDAGMYICFVTNSGFGALTYKSTHLSVTPRSKNTLRDASLNAANGGKNGRDIVISGAQSPSESFVLILVIGLVIITFLISVAVIVFVIRKSRKDQPKRPTGSQGRKTPDEEANIQQRPFLMSSSDMKYDSTASPASLPPPPSMFSSAPSSAMAPWSRTVYPTYGHIRSVHAHTPLYENPNHAKCFGRDSPGVGNQYEVPYSHLQPNTQSSSGKSSSTSNQSFSLANNNAMFASQPQFRYPHMGGGTAPISHVHGVPSHHHHHHHVTNSFTKDGPSMGMMSTGHLDSAKKEAVPFRSYPYFQYLGDYET